MDTMINAPLKELCGVINEGIIPSWGEEYPLVGSGMVKELYVSQREE